MWVSGLDIPAVIVSCTRVSDYIGNQKVRSLTLFVFGFEIIRRVPSQFHTGRVNKLAMEFVNAIEIGARIISESERRDVGDAIGEDAGHRKGIVVTFLQGIRIDLVLGFRHIAQQSAVQPQPESEDIVGNGFFCLAQDNHKKKKKTRNSHSRIG